MDTKVPSSLACSWERLSLEGLPAPLAARSSHSLGILNEKAYIFGGELKPRTPIGGDVIVVDLREGGQVKVIEAKQSPQWPCARVGAALVAHKPSNSLYLWGGRGGKDMSPIDVRMSNYETADSREVDDVWRFDVASEQWSKMSSTASRDSDFPQARSFHTMTIAADTLYVHAGCPAKGRVSDLNAFDITTQAWSSAPSAPEPGRGGTVLAAIRSPHDPNDQALVRWGDFCGHELGGPLDVFDPVTQRWTSYETKMEGSSSEPAKRSVHGLVPYYGTHRTSTAQGTKEVVAIMFMGEGVGAPAELGHDGAGKFLSDIYALLHHQNTYSWLPLEASGVCPEPRGWFAFDSAPSMRGKGTDIVLHGGLHETNERLHDAWILHVLEST
ncbi:hypothetical protein CBS101457_004897 [Exobasidium rhododendri]|nr:hypothetical protein CBS101457_004897 [Exobasidium rhododendri]